MGFWKGRVRGEVGLCEIYFDYERRHRIFEYSFKENKFIERDWKRGNKFAE